MPEYNSDSECEAINYGNEDCTYLCNCADNSNFNDEVTPDSWFYALLSSIIRLFWFGIRLALGYFFVNIVWVFVKQAVAQNYILPNYGVSHILSKCVFVQNRNPFESILFYIFC